MKSLLFLTLFFTTLSLKAEIIEFKIKSDNLVCKGLAQVIISQDKLVLHQFEVPLNGTGQVHLLTGNYQIDAFNKKGCSFQNLIQITEIPNKLVEINLEMQPRQLATTINSSNSPCGWNEFGCGGNYYPQSGNISVSQSKFYFVGKDEGKFTLKFSGDDFNVLSTIPSFKGKEVSGDLRRGSIYSDNNWYPHLFYDARIDDTHLQNGQGFCGNRKEILKFMTDGLIKYGFPDEARREFNDQIAVKTPIASRYCVYPQANAQLDKANPLEITFDDKTPTRTERLFYLIIPQDFKEKRIPAQSGKFSDKPKTTWKHYSRTVIPKTTYLYEWGIGFIFE